MSFEQTPRAMRPIITLVGCRNAGKSSLLNTLCGEDIAIVSEIAGTTTDAIAKAYELLPFGPVTFYDTAGLDDTTLLGQQRIKASKRTLAKTDLALLVVGEAGLTNFDKQIVADLKTSKTPVIVVFNKADATSVSETDKTFCQAENLPFISVSAKTKAGIDALKKLIVDHIP